MKKNPRHYHIWKTSEFKFIEDNYHSMSDTQLAFHLKVTTTALVNRRKILGLLRNNVSNFEITQEPLRRKKSA